MGLNVKEVDASGTFFLDALSGWKRPEKKRKIDWPVLSKFWWDRKSREDAKWLAQGKYLSWTIEFVFSNSAELQRRLKVTIDVGGLPFYEIGVIVEPLRDCFLKTRCAGGGKYGKWTPYYWVGTHFQDQVFSDK